MKKFKFYTLLLLAVITVFGCSKDYDDTELRNDVNDLKSRVAKLEEWCTTTNTQISALQGLVTALEAKDYVTGVSPIMEGAVKVGYTITFSKSGAITINHGKDGKDGKDGTDGIIPIIGVDKDTDGFYYWTIKIGDAAVTWMLDSNNKKIRTTGDKGADGQPGATGQSPTLSVATFTDGKVYWKVNGEWLLNNGQKVQATGDKGDKGDTGSTGATGAQGDAVFAANGVTLFDDYVQFTLAGTPAKTFTLPRTSDIQFFDAFTEFKVNDVKKELTLALNIKEDSYTALKAELTSSKGLQIAILKANTRAADAAWGIALAAPTFNADKSINENAKVTFTLPNGITEGEFALLKMTVVDKSGKEHSATRVIVYTTQISVEGVSLEDKSVEKGKTIKLEPTFTPVNATNKNAIWNSSNTAVATIAADGTVTGKTIGEATITATTADGGFVASCKIIVIEAPITVKSKYFYTDKSYSETLDKSKTCIGIVFWEDPENAGHGKIVSLDETLADWNSANSWATNKNTGNMSWRLPTRQELKQLFATTCGLTWVANNANANEVNDWTTEMPNNTNYSNQRRAFNAALAATNGTEFNNQSLNESYYWSSEAFVGGYMYYVSLFSGKISGDSSTNPYRVRAIATF